MISQTVEYALRAVVTIAQHEGHACTAQQISEITQVPAPYLSKLMQGLVRCGIAVSQRGLHGGFTLSKNPSDLTIWEVIEAVEPIKRIRQCPLDIKSHNSILCPLHKKLDQALASVEQQFRAVTVADILAEGEDAIAACQQHKTQKVKRTWPLGKIPCRRLRSKHPRKRNEDSK